MKLIVTVTEIVTKSVVIDTDDILSIEENIDESKRIFAIADLINEIKQQPSQILKDYVGDIDISSSRESVTVELLT